MVVEKIKDEKGEFWCDFANVGKLMSRHCIYKSLKLNSIFIKTYKLLKKRLMRQF